MASSVCDDSFGPHSGDCRGGFDLTLLFEESILVVPINALLLLAAPCRALYLLRRNAVKVDNSNWLYCKLVSPMLRQRSPCVPHSNNLQILCLLLILSQIGFLILCTHASTVTTRASLPAAALSFAASVSLLGLSYAEHVYSYRPSTVLNLFLLFSILFDGARTRTLWLQGYNRSAAIAAIVATVLKIVILAVEAIEKRGFLRPQYRALPPEVTSGIFSRWAFWWQLPLFRAGFSKKLEIEALFPLGKHFKSSYLQHQLQTRWAKCMSSHLHQCVCT